MQGPSRTALSTALVRSLHTRTDPAPLIHDEWGERLVPASAREAIAVRARDAGITPDVWLRANPAYGNVVIRSRYTEDALAAAVADGVRQYVLVGAGFDSYVLRRPASAQALHVFEVDHPATQELKLARLRDEGIATPQRCTFIAADLAQESLDAALARSGHDPRARTFFSWLGVTMYLPREANLECLRAMARCAAAGSEAVFTYLDEAAFRIDDPEHAFSRMKRSVAELGEPFLCGFEPAALDADLRAIGFDVEEDVDDRALLERYDPAGVNRLSTGGHGRIARVRRR